MATTESTSTQSQGFLDGNAVTFVYKPTANDESGSRISWAAGSQVHPDSTWSHIPTKDIITVAPSIGENDDIGTMYLIYLEDNPNTAELQSTASPKVFRKVEVRNPPSLLVQDFQPTPSTATRLQDRYDRADGHLNFHVIISSGSGTGLAQKVFDDIIQPVFAFANLIEGKDYALHQTTSETSVTELTTTTILPEANKGILQSILILSGDGGLLDIANVLIAGPRTPQYKKPNLAVLPLGTGNALAHSTGILHADDTLGLRNWIRGALVSLPLFRATFSPGAHSLHDEGRTARPLLSPATTEQTESASVHGAVVCSWGLHAALVADSDTAAYRRFGAERFKMAAQEALFPADGSPPHAYRGRVSVLRRKPEDDGQGRDGREEWVPVEREEHAYVLTTLVSNLEKGFTISPASRPLEGKLRLVHFGPMHGNEVMGVMGGAYQGGKHVEDERVGYEQVEGVRIEFDEEDARWRRVCVDGKIIRVEQNGWVEVRMERESVLDLVLQRGG